jgi:hypothetical protein
MTEVTSTFKPKVWTLKMVEAMEAMQLATAPAVPNKMISTRKATAAVVDDMSLEQEEIADDYTVTDEEILARLQVRFAVLEDMTRAIKSGHVRAMIVTGSPGVGKSHGVMNVLGIHDLLSDIASDGKLKKYEVIKGRMSALGLYMKLHEFRDSKSILVFDDCDEILQDELSLNMLKGALDSNEKRIISWNSDSRRLKDDGIPNSFEFEGGAIFITNINFDHVRSKKMRGHLQAMESRCHYLDLTINTQREKLLRIRQVIEGGALDKFDFDEVAQREVLDFVDDNKNILRELSVRMVLKVSELKSTFKTTWRDVAGITCVKKS